MKKNLLSIIILALLIVNIVLTAVMMFSTTNTNQKTAALVGDIAAALALDLSDPAAEEEVVADVPIQNISTYKFEDQLTITLKSNGSGKENYFITNVSLSMNTKEAGYKKYGSDEEIQKREDLMKSIIYEVVGSYTLEELRADNSEEASREILSQIQEMYGYEFIYKVNFIDYLYQ